MNELSKHAIATLLKFEETKTDTIQKLIAKPANRLKELKKYYYDWAESAAKSGYVDSAAVNQAYWMCIDEALQVQRGNDEQAWDYLS